MKTPNRKRNSRLRLSPSQSLKMHRRMYLVVGTCSMLLTGAMLFFFHFSNVESSKAQGEEQPQYIVMEDQVFVNDMSIAAPYVKTQQNNGQNIIFLKKMVADTIQK